MSSLSLLPRQLFSLPSLPSLWDDETDWFNSALPQTGVSVSEDDKKVFIEAALPGINPDDIEVSYQDGYVWIRGEMKAEEKAKDRKYYRQQAQAFSYRVAVPAEVDPAVEPEATSKNGIMTVTFTKSPVSQPKRIAVKKLEQ